MTWGNQTKHTSSFSKQSKHTSSFSTSSKHTSTFSKLSKNISSFINQSKDLINQFLLKEDGAYILLETGGKLILEQSIPSGYPFTNQVRH